MEKKKIKISPKIWIPLVAVGAVLLILAIVLPSVYYGAHKTDVKVNVWQVGDSQTIGLDWESGKQLDKLTVAVYHGDDLVSKKDLSKPEELSGELETNGFYGKMRVEVTAKRGMYTFKEKISVNVSTDEYNIAPITATMPVTLFTLSLQETTNSGEIPTFVWFKRSGAWDWNKLPENVYPMPVANEKEFLNSDETVMYSKTSAWVKELYEINKDSKFHFYYNDYYPQGWMEAAIGNKIPTDNYNVVLLSDGTASYKFFNDRFNNENAETTYAEMVEKYNKVKTQVANGGSYNYGSGYEIPAWELHDYAFVMANEESNVEWWVGRTDNTVFVPDNSEFHAKLAANSNVVRKDLGSLLTAIQNREEAEYMSATNLKKLYKFNDDVFEKAVQENKKIMIILGTWIVEGTMNEPYLEQYVKATMAYYGNDFVYYYKGHPKYPTNSIEGKTEQLTNMGLIDIDSTIPAELFFFFNPEAYGSGYSSTTFANIVKFPGVSDESECALFGYTKNEAKTNTAGISGYADNMDIFIKKVDNGALNGVVDNDNSFMVEFSDKILETAEYSVAVYDATANTFTYYKLVGEDYVVVNE